MNWKNILAICLLLSPAGIALHNKPHKPTTMDLRVAHAEEWNAAQHACTERAVATYVRDNRHEHDALTDCTAATDNIIRRKYK